MKKFPSKIAVLCAAMCLAVSAPSFAQDPPPDQPAPEGQPTEPDVTPEATDTTQTVPVAAESAVQTSKDVVAEEEAEEAEEEKEEEAKESAHGSYEWKASFGGGLEYGIFFTELERWNTYILDENVAQRLDISSLWYIDLAAEASVLEGTRFSVFGGMQRPFKGDPSVRALYVGLEPAFAFRRDFWELALGIGAGLGSAKLELETGESMNAGLVVLRPFLEVRRYIGTFSAVYGRFGFHQWLVNNPEFVDLDFTVPETNLDEGGPYFAIGVRFGHYPEHVKDVPDTDGDGMRDDIDECPEEAEDVDQFEDDDGCPEADNDKDGINDDVDKCPMRPEDKDGWQDEDGCPETDDDSDGDGILNAADQCPNDPEDEDGFEDQDGCPDPDNDGDNILDKDDKCPNKAGVKAKQGCPYELVEVTLDKIVIKDKVFFEFNKAVIKPESFTLLDQVADVINSTPRIKKIEVQGHTDHKGKAAYNKKLSEDRAKSVYEYLIGKGVDANRLTYAGYGSEKPLIPLGEDGKETEEEAAQNRRVEFVILEQDEVKKMIREDKLQNDGGDLMNKIPRKPAEGEETKPAEGEESKPAEGEESKPAEGDPKPEGEKPAEQ